MPDLISGKESAETAGATASRISYGWVILIVCTVLVTLGYGLSLSYSVFFKPLAVRFGWDRTTTSLVYSISWLTRGLVAIGVGWAADRFGARAVLTFSGIVTCLGFVLSSQVTTVWQFFFTYGILMAIGLSGTFGVGTSLVAAWFDKKSALPLGIVSMSSGLGSLVVVPITARLLVEYALSTTFIICGVAGGLIMVVGAMFLRPAPPRAKPTQAEAAQAVKNVTLREALHYSELYLLMSVFFIFVFTTQIVMIHLVNYATDLGMDPLKAAGFVSLLGLVSMAGRLLTGLIGDRIDTLTLMVIAPLATIAAFVLLVFSKSLLSLYLFVAVFGIAYGAEVPLTPIMAKRYFGTKAMATLVGVFQLAGGFGGFSGPLLAGKIFDETHSYHLVFIIGAVIVALCLIPIGILKKRSLDESRALRTR